MPRLLPLVLLPFACFNSRGDPMPIMTGLSGNNNWSGTNSFNGLSAGGGIVSNVGTPVQPTDAVNKSYTDAHFVKFVPAAEQLSVVSDNRCLLTLECGALQVPAKAVTCFLT